MGSKRASKTVGASVTFDFRKQRRRARFRAALPILGAAMLPMLGAGGLMLSEDRGPLAAKAEKTPDSIEIAAATGVRLPDTRPRERQATLVVEPGDTMMNLLQETGITRRDAYTAVTALKDVYQPRNLRPGQEIHVDLRTGDSRSGTPRLTGLRLRASADADVALHRTQDGAFVAQSQARELTRQAARAQGRIDSSLMAAAQREQVPMAPLLSVIRAFSYAVDFQRDLHKGDEFEIFYERFTEAGGALAKTGDVLYAALKLRDDALELYRFEHDNGVVGYYDQSGESARRLLMRTPINGARLSSGYGMRKHPILGYNRMHKGLDFAAPTGTPIYAAGHGTVEYAGWNSGYGRYIRIRHNGTYKTAYGHMNRLAKNVRSGARVSQGDVIGYVGSTGRSTGPHLHYEVIKHGKKLNPRNLNLPTGHRLTGAALDRFEAVRKDIDAQRRNAGSGTRVASAGACGEGRAESC